MSHNAFRNLITAQAYLDPDKVAEKRRAKDYDVLVTPCFTMGGVKKRAVLDGHHSLAAAKADKADPRFYTAGSKTPASVAPVRDAATRRIQRP